MKTKEVIWRIIKFFYTKIPTASILSTLAYVLENFHPTIMTVLSAYLLKKLMDIWQAAGMLRPCGDVRRLYWVLFGL